PPRRSRRVEDAPPPPPRTLTTRAQRLDRSALPYRCGLVFFYHVPSTGGATINQWLGQYRDDFTAKYFTHWGRRPDGRAREGAEDIFLNGNDKHGGMRDFANGLEQDEWRIAHCHHSSMHLNLTERHLSQWRSEVESRGCAFVANVMFRDPLSHALSLYKHIERFGSKREAWATHLRTKSEMGHWQTQLDYFLYNFMTRNPLCSSRPLPHQCNDKMKDGVEKDAKVRRALEILREHFDIVTVGEHDRYKRELLAVTGWKDREMTRTNTYSKELTFTKKEVEELQRLLEENGDTEFM
ncbi:hypothetical protein ACHAWF_013835, partial [Thalassiosira exigua]